MRTTTLGPLEVSRIGLGAMGMSYGYTGSGTAREQSVATLRHAFDLGVTFVDTAEIYGPFDNEELVAEAVAGRRDEIVIASKFGMYAHDGRGAWVLDSSPANVRAAVEGSLRRLGTDRIDLYYQHRVDPLVPIEETVGVLGELVTEGKVLAIGLSEAGPDTIRRAHAVHPVAALQSEYSLWTRDPEAVLPLLRELGIGLVPWSPLGHGFLTESLRTQADLDALDEDDFRKHNPRFTGDNFTANVALADTVAEVAARVGATPAQVALAWLMAQGDDVVPIPGTRQAARVEENTASVDVVLGPEELATLDAMPAAAGPRLPQSGMAQVDG